LVPALALGFKANYVKCSQTNLVFGNISYGDIGRDYRENYPYPYFHYLRCTTLRSHLCNSWALVRATTRTSDLMYFLQGASRSAVCEISSGKNIKPSTYVALQLKKLTQNEAYKNSQCS